jgi:hypothetical protein
VWSLALLILSIGFLYLLRGEWRRLGGEKDYEVPVVGSHPAMAESVGVE